MRRYCHRGYHRHGWCANAWPIPVWAVRVERGAVGWEFWFACDTCRRDRPELAWKPYLPYARIAVVPADARAIDSTPEYQVG